MAHIHASNALHRLHSIRVAPCAFTSRLPGPPKAHICRAGQHIPETNSYSEQEKLVDLSAVLAQVIYALVQLCIYCGSCSSHQRAQQQPSQVLYEGAHADLHKDT